ncbi:MAG: hypothetical protein Q7S63_02435 [bacterium]|nr:hypothetical protein [bacterium]
MALEAKEISERSGVAEVSAPWEEEKAWRQTEEQEALRGSALVEEKKRLRALAEEQELLEVWVLQEEPELLEAQEAEQIRVLAKAAQKV